MKAKSGDRHYCNNVLYAIKKGGMSLPFISRLQRNQSLPSVFIIKKYSR